MASLQGVRCEFPTQRNRELFQRNRELFSRNKEFQLAKLQSSPDKIFGTKNLWVMFAILQKTDIHRLVIVLSRS